MSNICQQTKLWCKVWHRLLNLCIKSHISKVSDILWSLSWLSLLWPLKRLGWIDAPWCKRLVKNMINSENHYSPKNVGGWKLWQLMKWIISKVIKSHFWEPFQTTTPNRSIVSFYLEMSLRRQGRSMWLRDRPQTNHLGQESASVCYPRLWNKILWRRHPQVKLFHLTFIARNDCIEIKLTRAKQWNHWPVANK